MWIVIRRACWLEGRFQPVGKKIEVSAATGNELIVSGKAAVSSQDPPPTVKRHKAD